MTLFIKISPLKNTGKNKRLYYCFIYCLVLASLTAGCAGKAANMPAQTTGLAVEDLSRPFSRKFDSAEIINAFSDKGLEAVDIKQSIILGAPAAADNIVFMIPSYGIDTGGLVSEFNTKDMLARSIQYYLKMNSNPESPVWWIFRRDNILLLISGKVPESRAKEYEKVLLSINR